MATHRTLTLPDYETCADGDGFLAYIDTAGFRVANDFGEILIDGEHFAGLDHARALALAILTLTDPDVAAEIRRDATEHGARLFSAEVLSR